MNNVHLLFIFKVVENIFPMTDKKKLKQKKEHNEEPIIDKSGESLKKLYLREKNRVFKRGLNVKVF